MDIQLDKLANISISVENLQLITAEQAWSYGIVPCESSINHISFVTSNETNQFEIQSELEILFGKEIKFIEVSEEEFQKLIGKHYRKDANNEVQVIHEGDDFLTKLIREAKNLGSSDIHIESYEERNRVRIRIDGHLVERYAIEKQEYPSIVNKIKIMSNMDIAEKRLPQDGRIFFNKDNMKFDIRVSVLPTLHGEKIVLRLLNNDATDIELETLGFSKEDLENYLEGIKQHNGIILISGPTGSGKTTTLYATLKLLNQEERNIVTIEDPIEYTLEGINQVQLKESIGLDFASALKTFLRQDPDIIMLGEIRDKETASMAIRASLTGHLVLSTIHTNSAWDTISRLIDMGIPAYLIASTLRTSIAQRLVRLLCPNCKEKRTFDALSLPKAFKPYQNVVDEYVGKGCDKCHYTGYKGRKAIYEVIPVDREVASLIKENKSDADEHLREKGVKSLSENAYQIFADGDTSLEEIYSLLIN